MTEALAAGPKTPVDAFRLVGTRLDGKYLVEALVAEGGFGIVYRCAHTELQKAIALKVLKIPGHLAATAKGEFFKRFNNEARTIGRIEHESIVRVLDFGTSIMPTGELAPWMALEWLDGATLERDLDRRTAAGPGGRSPSECLALMHPVIEAVALAHDEGIAHRDIKPGNLMLIANRRGDLRLKLLDFGIAKVMADDDRAPSSGQTSTQAHLQMFSLDYAAPEQMSGTRSGPWTDVHALGLVLSELLTGMQPYDGEDSVEIFSEALSRRRPTPARRGLDVGAWEPVLLRALALRPADRFPNATAFLDALLAEVPSTAVWRASLQPALSPPASDPPRSPVSERPARFTSMNALPAAAKPLVEARSGVPESQRITTLLPTPPPSPDDDEPVQLPLNRLGGLAWLALALGLAGVGALVFVTQREPVVVVRPTPPSAVSSPAPPAVAAPPVIPTASAVLAPPLPALPPAVASAPPALMPAPTARVEPRAPAARPAVRRLRLPSSGRIPIE